jgi:hypothetical protein
MKMTNRKQKINWLLENEYLWSEFPAVIENIHSNPKAEKIGRLMQNANLYSQKTYIKDIVGNLPKLISEARTERRNRQWIK